MSDIHELLKADSLKADKIQANKVVPFAYTQTAYDTDDADGVASFDFEAEQNIPLKEYADIAEMVSQKGLRSQSASLPRMFMNHLFGRLSYNVNKLSDITKSVTSFLLASDRRGGLYSPVAEYAYHNFCFFVVDETIAKGIVRYFIRTSSTPEKLINTPPINALGEVDSAHWEEIFGSLDALVSWKAKHTYTINEATFHEGIPYRAKRENKGVIPTSSLGTDWELVGGGASVATGFVNKNGDLEEGAENEFTAYFDGAVAYPTNGSGVLPDPSLLSITVDKVAPLNGTTSLVITKESGNALGYGVAKTFSVERGSIGSKAEISFSYVSSIGYTDEGITMFVLSPSGSVFPLGNKLRDSFNAPSVYRSSFTPVESGEHKLCWHISSSDVTAYTILVDNVSLAIHPSVVTYDAKLAVSVDENYLVEDRVNNVVVSANVAITIPSSFELFSQVTVRRLHATDSGYVTITPPAGTTIEGRSEFRLYGQYSYWTIERVSATVFALVGGYDKSSNANGFFTKYFDGRLIQGKNTTNLTTPATNGTIDVTFPIPFANDWTSGLHVSLTLVSQAGYYPTLYMTNGYPTTTKFNFTYSSSSTEYARYSYLATGRW